jgi:Family of unknown function (DUF6256)
MIDGVPVRIVAPLVASFALFLAVLAASVRHRTESTKGRPRDFRSFLRWIVVTVSGGYVAFLSIVFVFHRILAGQRDVLGQAARGGAVLAYVIALPAFVLLSRIEAALRERRDGRHRDLP